MKNDCQDCLVEKDAQNPDQIVTKCVGPIWGQYEAEKKVNAYMAKNGMSDDWIWTGAWWSENCTSYATLKRK